MAETCFIIDDEPIEVMALELMLKESFNNLKVFSATGGRQALKLVDDYRPDIMIVDIQMPGINGLDLIKEMKALYPKVQVLVVSAHDYFEYAQRAIQLGVKNYLVKPASREEIVQTVRGILGEINKEKQTKKEQFMNKEKVDISNIIIKKEMLNGLISGAFSSDKYEMYLELLGLQGHIGMFVVVCNKEKHQQEAFIDTWNLWRSRKYTILKTTHENYSVYLIFFPSQQQPSDYEDLIKNDLISFTDRLDSQIAWGVGKTAKTAEELTLSFQKALSTIYHDNYLKFKVEKYIKDHYHHDLKLEDVAGHANLSIYYFSKWFKKNFNQTFSEYLSHLRMNMAVNLLAQTDLNVKEISYRVGFNDPNYFSKLFKKIVGKSPTDYR